MEATVVEKNEEVKGPEDKNLQRYTEVLTTGSCSICHREDDGQPILMAHTVCNHSFCATCLETWLKRKRTCPLCRCVLCSRKGGSLFENDETDEEPRIIVLMHRVNNIFAPHESPLQSVFETLSRILGVLSRSTMVCAVRVMDALHDLLTSRDQLAEDGEESPFRNYEQLVMTGPCVLCHREDEGSPTSMTQTPCSHYFCSPCLQRWLLYHIFCPLCGSIIRDSLPRRLMQNDNIPRFLPDDEVSIRFISEVRDKLLYLLVEEPRLQALHPCIEHMLVELYRIQIYVATNRHEIFGRDYVLENQIVNGDEGDEQEELEINIVLDGTTDNEEQVNTNVGGNGESITENEDGNIDNEEQVNTNVGGNGESNTENEDGTTDNEEQVNTNVGGNGESNTENEKEELHLEIILVHDSETGNGESITENEKEEQHLEINLVRDIETGNGESNTENEKEEQHLEINLVHDSETGNGENNTEDEKELHLEIILVHDSETGNGESNTENEEEEHLEINLVHDSETWNGEKEESSPNVEN